MGNYKKETAYRRQLKDIDKRLKAIFEFIETLDPEPWPGKDGERPVNFTPWPGKDEPPFEVEPPNPCKK